MPTAMAIAAALTGKNPEILTQIKRMLWADALAALRGEG